MGTKTALAQEDNRRGTNTRNHTSIVKQAKKERKKNFDKMQKEMSLVKKKKNTYQKLIQKNPQPPKPEKKKTKRGGVQAQNIHSKV